MSCIDFSALHSALDVLMKRMENCELEEFQLDKSTDFSDSAVGRVNRARAEVMMLAGDVCAFMYNLMYVFVCK